MQHSEVVKYRVRYGDNWLTVFSDDLSIPWRQLTLQEFLDINDLADTGRYTSVEIEDEIFSLGVLNSVYVDNIDILPAGIISTIAAQIMHQSGPSSSTQINIDLNNARGKVQDFISSVIPFICSVFPAYKPEDLFQMKYKTFIERLAMTEQRLLILGIIKEPFAALTDGVEQVPVELPSQKKRRQIQEQKNQRLEEKLTNLNTPVTSKPTGVITSDQMNSHADNMYIPDLSKDPGDYLINQKKIRAVRGEAIAGLESIYPEYFKMMKEGKKLTPEDIQEVKGSNKSEVKEKHKEYFNKLKTGEIKPYQPEPVKLVKQEPPVKAKVKRR